MIAELIAWTLRARWGLAAVVITANLAGVAVILTQLWLSGFLGRIGPDWPHTLALISIYPVIGLLTGVVLAYRDRTIHLGWIDQKRRPTPDQAHQLLRLPIVVSARALGLWIPGVIISVSLFAKFTPENDPAVTTALITIGAFESAALTFLIVDRMTRPAMPVVAQVLGETMHWSSSVLSRVVVTWAVSGALPLLMLIVVLADPAAGASDRIRTAVYLSAVGIAVGALATAFLARSVATPMRTLRLALERISDGQTDVRVPIGSASEIGRLENSVNALAANLRERDRMRAVFGRHVGDEVAERALAGGAKLTGDVRVVSALFVDVTGSVTLSTQLAPEEFVAKLNRLLAIVVAATEDNNGLVNKFEGDAALCVFGAPVALGDDATPALRAARRIRDEVRALGEFDIGIGVARGQVFAGDVGTASRLEYTVIGDAVNEAARLTGEAKHAPRRILVSGSLIEAAAPHERVKWTVHEPILLRGMSEPTATWTDVDVTAIADAPSEETIAPSAEALDAAGEPSSSAITEIRSATTDDEHS
ncbi:adenylate/guanylate cyclase domain-containing protein [Nocardia higoensis]|uniref:Adenylate/guanylate cyclase domain-containing protein n=1 Tax=Nocardia higoensis TaxID=228599 RepID=A0ABS0DAA0_9NOCA|nr:adenylate/guanylate cyclase domain-containing protein [Nocardia higoensis]MBF6355380.1 adenylate/guanylate cyclase domain-containing protein [Nocardia higoensis]